MMSPLARGLVGTFYRLTQTGAQVPRHGPALLVANHPNSLLDPALVAAAAGRTVRFLAKAPLFESWQTRWLVNLARAIPVHRRQDGGPLAGGNIEAFEAVHAALAAGAAVAIFPEGLSHSEPALAQLRTGAARMALGARARMAQPVPIIPIGLWFEDKESFRSRAHVIIGPAVTFEDLIVREGAAPEGQAPAGEPALVRALTARIDDALRAITLNLEAWEDRPLIDCAVDVYDAERAAAAAVRPATVMATAELTVEPEADRAARALFCARALRQLRARGAEDETALLLALRRHDRRLRRLGLAPKDLHASERWSAAVAWSVRRAWLLTPPSLLVTAACVVAFAIPYRLTDWLAAARRRPKDVRATYKLLLGLPIYAAWLMALGSSLTLFIGWLAGASAGAGAVVVGLVGLRLMERQGEALSDIRRFALLRSRRELLAALKAEQGRLGQALFARVKRA